MTTTRSDIKEFVDMSGPTGPRLIQLPGLDGLRGLAVLAVVLYHMGFEQVRGGYLGVSTFFTLSGFLITSLLVNELRRDDRTSLRRFWIRRFRRLMPAALVTLVVVTVVFGRTLATPDQRLAIRGDVLSSLFYVANWRFILAGTTYGDFSASPSPVLHFWSLSIEEQFYIVFPLLVTGSWLVMKRFFRTRVWVIGVILAVLAILSSLQPLSFDMSTNSAYLASTVRAAEILFGGVLAVVLSRRSVRRRLAVETWSRRVLGAAALLVVAVQIWWVATVDQTSWWLYRGGLPLFALMTCVLIVAAAVPVGPVRSALGTAALRWLGTRSYGVYLYHWPLLVAARQWFPATPNTVRSVVAVAIASGLAEVSYRFLEAPIRSGRWPTERSALRYAVVAFVVVALVAVIPLPVDRSRLGTDFEAEERSLAGLAREITPTTSAPAPDGVAGSDATTTTDGPAAGQTTDTPPTTSVPAPAPPKVMVFGDSTGLLVSRGLAESILEGTTTRLAFSQGVVELGCGVSRFEAHKFFTVARPQDKCYEWPTTWSEALGASDPDIAMVITGAWEVLDVRIPGSQTWTSIGDPSTDDFIRAELDRAVELLSEDGALVVLWLWPPYAPWASDNGRAAVARQHEPARMERLHEIMREVAAAHPDSVRVFDLGAYLGEDRLADHGIRPDGHHIPTEVMAELFGAGLDATIDDLFVQWWEAGGR